MEPSFLNSMDSIFCIKIETSIFMKMQSYGLDEIGRLAKVNKE